MENPFKAGDIVFHKANNLRMVVLASFTSRCNCRYVSASGEFVEMQFFIEELSPKHLEFTVIRYQLESKSATK